jgi:hypothetical protein
MVEKIETSDEFIAAWAEGAVKLTRSAQPADVLGCNGPEVALSELSKFNRAFYGGWMFAWKNHGCSLGRIDGWWSDSLPEC